MQYGGVRLTFEELNQRANALTERLREDGVGPEVFVALCFEPCIELIVGMLATLKAGGAYVPLDPRTPRERIQFILEETRAPVGLTFARFRSSLPAVSAKVLVLDELPSSAPATR